MEILGVSPLDIGMNSTDDIIEGVFNVGLATEGVSLAVVTMGSSWLAGTSASIDDVIEGVFNVGLAADGIGLVVVTASSSWLAGASVSIDGVIEGLFKVTPIESTGVAVVVISISSSTGVSVSIDDVMETSSGVGFSLVEFFSITIQIKINLIGIFLNTFGISSKNSK